MQVQGNNKVYTGVWQGLRHMMATEGVRGMMKGNLANCIRIVPNSAMKFLTYEQLSRRVQLINAAQLRHSSVSALSAHTWLLLPPFAVAYDDICSGYQRLAPGIVIIRTQASQTVAIYENHTSALPLYFLPNSFSHIWTAIIFEALDESVNCPNIAWPMMAIEE